MSGWVAASGRAYCGRGDGLKQMIPVLEHDVGGDRSQVFEEPARGASINACLNANPAALIASSVIGSVRNWLTRSFGIDGSLATARSSFLTLLGIIRLLGVGYAPHTELRTGSRLAESTVNAVISKRFAKRQQMQWTKRGAHLLLQTRTRALDGTLRPLFERWYPGLANDNTAGTAQVAAA